MSLVFDNHRTTARVNEVMRCNDVETTAAKRHSMDSLVAAGFGFGICVTVTSSLRAGMPLEGFRGEVTLQFDSIAGANFLQNFLSRDDVSSLNIL
jgi:hypothetical protein